VSLAGVIATCCSEVAENFGLLRFEADLGIAVNDKEVIVGD